MKTTRFARVVGSYVHGRPSREIRVGEPRRREAVEGVEGDARGFERAMGARGRGRTHASGSPAWRGYRGAGPCAASTHRRPLRTRVKKTPARTDAPGPRVDAGATAEAIRLRRGARARGAGRRRRPGTATLGRTEARARFGSARVPTSTRRDGPARRAGKRVTQRGGRRGNAFTRRGRSDPDSGVGFGGAKNRMRVSHKIAHVSRAKCRARVEGNRVRRASWILARPRRSLRPRANRRSSAKWEFRSHPRMRFSGGRPLFPAFSQSSRAWARVRLRRAKRSSGVVVEAVRRARERGTMLPQVCHVMTARGVVALGPSLCFPSSPSG